MMKRITTIFTSNTGHILPYTLIVLTFLTASYLLNLNIYQSKYNEGQEMISSYQTLILYQLAKNELKKQKEQTDITFKYNIGEVNCHFDKNWEVTVKLNDSETMYKEIVQK